MARKREPIPPFPADIDRHAFGHYLAGLTDGEGCFRLCWASNQNPLRRKTPHAVYLMRLRADDAAILNLVQSFLGCGTLYLSKSAKRNDQIQYRACTIRDLTRAVIPQFDTYALRAKKANDYRIWREGVMVIARARGRRRQGRTVGRGSKLKWTDAEVDYFRRLTEALRNQRLFTSNGHPLPPQPPPPKGEGPTLFDSLPD